MMSQEKDSLKAADITYKVHSSNLGVEVKRTALWDTVLSKVLKF